MIKGVNRQVIEVVDTGSPYFERAILIINPRSAASQSAICGEAARIFCEKSGTKKGPAPLSRFMLAGGCAAFGAAAAAVLMKLLS